MRLERFYRQDSLSKLTNYFVQTLRFSERLSSEVAEILYVTKECREDPDEFFAEMKRGGRGGRP